MWVRASELACVYLEMDCSGTMNGCVCYQGSWTGERGFLMKGFALKSYSLQRKQFTRFQQMHSIKVKSSLIKYFMLCKAFIRHLIQHLLIPFKRKRSCGPHGEAVFRGGLQPQQNHTEDEGRKTFFKRDSKSLLILALRPTTQSQRHWYTAE